MRAAAVPEAEVVARLLDDFNREYDTPSPGTDALTVRLRQLLAGGDVVALLVGDPAVGLGVVTLRPNVWHAGPFGLLDELYGVAAQRGSALLRAAEEVVRARGGELLEINVDGDDVAVRRFYERHGYRNSEPGTDEPLLYYFRDLSD